MRLNRLSVLKGQSHHVLIGIVLCILILYYTWIILVVLMYLIVLFKREKRLFTWVLIGFMTYMISRYYYDVVELPENLSSGEILYKDRSNRALLRNGNTKFYLYYDNIEAFSTGDIVHFKGRKANIDRPANIGDFDYRKFLYGRKISGVFYAEEVSKVAQTYNVYYFKEVVSNYINTNFNYTKPYIKTFILAESDEIESSLHYQTSRLGVTHLFAISGLHIALLATTLDKTLKRLNLSEKHAFNVVLMVLISYGILTTFVPSVLRASLLYITLNLNRRYQWQFTAVDITSWIGVMLLIHRPLAYVQTGFILTFIVSIGLLLSQSELQKGTRIMQMLKVSTIAFLCSLPIVTAFHYSFNPLTIVFNLIFVVYAMFLLLPLIYMTFLIPFIEPVLTLIIMGFEGTVNIVYQYFNWQIRLYFDHPLKIVAYYIVLGFSLANLRNRFSQYFITLFIVYVSLIHMTPYISFKQQLIFFQVNGDSTLITDRFNHCNILIDTGNEDNYKRLNHHLHRLHITHLDYVILTHWHKDHYGAYDDLTKAFSVKTTITNSNQENYDNHWIECGNIAFFIYPLEFPHQSENNRSIAMMVIISQERILMTGDIEIEREETMIEYALSATLLKVAHHGSNTSTHANFLNHVNPEDAVIMAHKYNNFGHPSEHTLNRLKKHDINIHRTDKEGMIIFEYVFNKRIKRTPFSP